MSQHPGNPGVREEFPSGNGFEPARCRVMLRLAFRCRHRWFAICVLLALAGTSRTSHAWAIGSQINETGCHEPITAQALRSVRAKFDTAPTVAPSRDEAAMIAAVLFSPPEDFVSDLAAMTLLLGVRDNDLKGINPLSSLDLVQVHGNPTTQDEHCIRSAMDDGAAGNQSALEACRRFIARTVAEALDGLDPSGTVDATRRAPLTMYVGIRGQIEPPLPVFYMKIGAAMHALEDGFPHSYRTADGTKVTVVLNWIDLVGDTYDEARDGPPHRAELDRCWDESDPIIHRNYELATQAATELLSVALDPGLTREQKLTQVDAVTAKYLGYQPGCTFDNQWCEPGEAAVTNAIGCNAGGPGALASSALLLLGAIALRRRRIAAAAGVLLVAALFATNAHADPPPTSAPPSPAPVAGTPAANATPAVPTSPTVPSTEPGKEPGRDVPTPTVTEVAKVREDKKLGSPWGFTASAGAAVDRPAGAVTVGGRYRITEQWIVGLDAGWNPWVTTSPMMVHAGVATLAGTLIRRFPMKFDRVNLRTSLHLGVSTLLFDVYGAPKYSTGPYGAFSPLGLDYDLGHAVRIVWDPIEIAMPVPLLGQLPLYYEQFRMMLGIQIGG
jgi:uncharacterized protein (TIGR03382 family)